MLTARGSPFLALLTAAIWASSLVMPTMAAHGGSSDTSIWSEVCTSAVGTFSFKGCTTSSSSSSHGHRKRKRAHGQGSSSTETCYCTNEAYAVSLFACIDTYIPEEHQSEATSTLVTACSWSDDDVDTYTQAAKTVNASEPQSTSATVSTAFLISEYTYTATYNSEYVTLHSSWANTAYGASLLGYWGCVLVLKMLTNVLSKFGMSVLKRVDGKLIRQIRSHIVLAPTFKYRHATPVSWWGWTLKLPSRQESLIVLGSCILNTIFLFADYGYYKPNTSSAADVFPGLYGERSGFLAMFLFPLMMLFGGRNNFLLWLTGWPLDTFNVFHKWLGRIIVVDLFVHAVAYSFISANYTSMFMKWGLTAFICGVVILIQGNHFFRARSYEIFLVFHILLAVFFCIGAWYHFTHAQGDEWLYAGIAIWCVDRIARWVRIAWSGGLARGHVQYYPSTDVFVIKIKYSKWWKHYPGCYAFVHVLKGAYFWQSHPYSLTEDPTTPGQLKLFSKARKGYTRRVANAALKAPNHAMDVRLALEGPYGSHHPLHHYDTMFLIAGGIGITATYPYAADSIKRDSKQRIIFVWIVSTDDSFEWFEDELKHLSRDPRVELRLYVSTASTSSSLVGSSASSIDGEKNVANETVIPTSQPGSQTASQTASTSSLDEKNASDKLGVSAVPRRYGRPDLKQMVRQEMLEAYGSTCFLTCGPDGVLDDVRVSVSKSLAEAKGRVDYFEEAYSW